MPYADSISFSIQRVANLLLRESDQVLQERLGIGMSQLRILTIVEGNPSLLQRDIADALGQTEAAISRQVKLLHRKQLLATKVNSKNRRGHITTLTSKGLRMTEAALEVLQSFQAPFVSDFSRNQQAELLAMLGVIEERIILTSQHRQYMMAAIKL